MCTCNAEHRVEAVHPSVLARSGYHLALLLLLTATHAFVRLGDTCSIEPSGHRGYGVTVPRSCRCGCNGGVGVLDSGCASNGGQYMG